MTKPITGDAAGQIQAAICAIADGGTVDARAFAGTSPTFQSNPFADPVNTSGHGTDVTAKSVNLLLPAGTITVYVPIGIPRFSTMVGQGSLNTTLQMSTSFPGYAAGTPNSMPSNNCAGPGSGVPCFPIICMGVNTTTAPMIYLATYGGNSCETPPKYMGNFVANARVQVEGLRIDLGTSANTPTSYAVGVQNCTAQEKSWVKNAQIEDIGNGGRGINIAGTGSQSSPEANAGQNSGPYTDLEINYGGSTCGGSTCECTSSSYWTANTYGIFVANGPSVTVGKGGHITVNGNVTCASTDTPVSTLIGIEADGNQVDVENIHAAKYSVGVQTGANQGGVGETISNLSNEQNNTTLFAVSSSNHTTGIASALYNVGTNLINDTQASFTSTATNFDFYPWGKSTDNAVAIVPPVNMLGKFSGYNNVATLGLGVPAVYGVFNKTNQSGSLAVSNIIALPSVAGEYTVHYYIDQSGNCSTIGSVVFTFGWTDVSASRTATSPTMTLGLTVGNNYIEGAIPIYSVSGQPISVSSTVTGCASGTYDVHVSAEQTQ